MATAACTQQAAHPGIGIYDAQWLAQIIMRTVGAANVNNDAISRSPPNRPANLFPEGICSDSRRGGEPQCASRPSATVLGAADDSIQYDHAAISRSLARPKTWSGRLGSSRPARVTRGAA